MNLSGRKVFWGGVLLILVSVPLWRPWLQDFLAPPGFEYLQKNEVKPVDRFIIHGMRFSRSRSGVIDTTVNAARAYGGSLGGTAITMEKVSIILYDGDGQQALVESRTGRYDPETGQIVLPEAFSVVSERARIKGKGLYYDLESGNYRVEGGVVCELNSA